MQVGSKCEDKGIFMNASGRIQVSHDENLNPCWKNQRKVLAEFADGLNVGHERKR